MHRTRKSVLMGMAYSPVPNPRLLRFASIAASSRCALPLLLTPLNGKTGHLLLERFAVVLLRCSADVPTGGEHMAVPSNLLQRRALAEARDVGILAGVLASPGVIGVCDAGDVLLGQVPAASGRACAPACERL